MNYRYYSDGIGDLQDDPSCCLASSWFHRLSMLKTRLLGSGLILILGSSLVLGEKSDIKLLTPTTRGSAGLFTLPVAETPRQGEFGLGLNLHRFNRDPGALSFTVFPVSVSLGLHDRVEAFLSFEAYKRMSAGDVLTHKVQPDDRLLPAYVASAEAVGYFNDAPFVDVPLGDGAGEVWAGAKFNVLSERGIGCLSLALQPVVRFSPSSRRSSRLEGLASGAFDVGLDLVASKRLKGRGTLTGKAGFLSGRDVDGVGRQSHLEWGVGVEWPLVERFLRVIGEVDGNTFVGRTKSGLTNVVDPLDAYLGIRIPAKPWLTLSGALSLHLKNASSHYPTMVPSSRFGWLFQASFQRKINRVPTVECFAGREKVVAGET
ncbi:MAG: hypothetical protein ACWGQW_11850, partial [bacterium]